MTPVTQLAPWPRNALGLLIVLAVVFPVPAFAQVNVEALRRDDPPLGYSGTVGGDLTLRTGNVDLFQLGLEARLYRVTDSMTRLIIGNGGLGLLSGSRFASSGLLHFRQTYDTEGHFSPEWWGQLNYDRPQLLDFRALTGAGVRTSFAGGEWGQFGMGAALMVEHERLDLAETAVHDSNTTLVRGTSFLALRLVPNENFLITSTMYLQPAVGDWGDTRTLVNLRLASSITNELDLTVSFDLRHDSRPPDGIAALDTSLRTGLRYTY